MDNLRLGSADQADGLRKLFATREPQVIAFASGRDTPGRTTLLVQTAVALANVGEPVVIVDENPAPDNIASAFGLCVRFDLLQAIRGERSLAHVGLNAAPLIKVIPAARAARELDHLSHIASSRLASEFSALRKGASFTLVDCSTSRRAGHLSAIAALAQHVVIVVMANGPGITHGYAAIKRVFQDQGTRQFKVVVTRARSPEEAYSIYRNMRRVALEHLGVQLDYLGASAVPATDHLAEALLGAFPDCRDDLQFADLFRPGGVVAERDPSAFESVL